LAINGGFHGCQRLLWYFDIFHQLLSCPATFQAICGVLRRDLVVPASFRQVSGELLEMKVSVWLQVFRLVFQTVQFSVFLV